MAAILGLVLGGVIGLPIGFVLYLVLREMVIPISLWSSDAVQWAIILPVAGILAALGFWQGRWPSRGGRAVRAAFLGFLWGAPLCGLVAAVLGLVAGEVLGVSQREGAFAMGVVFVIAPFSAFLGGLGVAFWRGRRAWRS